MIRARHDIGSLAIVCIACLAPAIFFISANHARADETPPAQVTPDTSDPVSNTDTDTDKDKDTDTDTDTDTETDTETDTDTASETAKSADSKAIYGRDDRVEVQQATAVFRQAARSVAALFASSDLDVTFGDQWFLPRSQKLVDVGWCPDERFAQQTAAARCTGFLATPDTLVTSAHCVRKDEDIYQDGLACADLSVVFDYAIPESGVLETHVSAARHFRCSAVIGRYLDPGGADWTVIRLDRAVPDRAPLPLYAGTEIPANSILSVIGHPLGLPAKLSGNGDIIEQGDDGYFVTNLDTYAGNSGSPVFMEDPAGDSLLVVGILSRGDTDAESRLLSDGQTCQASRLCDETGCQGEHVTRSSVLPDLK